jgi:hypothetical protein
MQETEPRQDQENTSLSFRGEHQWYSLGFSHNESDTLRVALGSLNDKLENTIDILQIDQNRSAIVPQY